MAPFPRSLCLTIFLITAFGLTSTNAFSLSCLQQYKLQSNETTGNVTCPTSCPYVSECSGSVQCVESADCGRTQIRGQALTLNNQKLCSRCRVYGCSECGKSDTSCKTCSSGYTLTNNLCVWSDWTGWIVLLVVGVFLAIWVQLDMLLCHCRSTTNTNALKDGLEHRARGHVRDLSKPEQPLYSLFAALHTEPICGPGMPLFMNWFIFVGIVAIWLLILSAALAPSSSEEEASTLSSAQLCFVASKEGAKPPIYIPSNAVLWTGLSYFGTLLLSIIFLFVQQRLWDRVRNEHHLTSPPLSQFALEASGFPPDAVDTEELYNFWRSILKEKGLSLDGVIEVSIAYDFHEKPHEVLQLLDQHQNLVSRGFTLKTAAGDSDSQAPNKIEPQAGTPWVQVFSYVMLGTDLELCGRRLRSWSPTTPEMTQEEANSLLATIPNSGVVIVVLRTQDLVKKIVSGQIPEKPMLFRGAFPISVAYMNEEPVGVRWQNFGVPFETRIKRLIACAFVLAAVLVVWVAMYWPWSAFTWRTIGSTDTVATVTNFSLGLIISLGNAIVGVVVQMLTDYFDFRYTYRAQLCYLLVIVPCVFINVACDLYVTMSTAVAQVNANLSTDVSFATYTGLRLVMDDLFNLVVPGYTIIPYIGEPMVTLLLTYWLAIWRIKRDTRISGEHAERLLEAPPIDIVNPPYCDFICVTSTFLITFLAPSSSHWKFFAALLGFAVLVYFQNRIRILRWQSPAQFGSDYLHRAESYLWALPLGLLAASFGSHVAGHDRRSSVEAGCGAFFLHLVAHVAFVKWIVPTTYSCLITPETALEYHEALPMHYAAATYRNTNPIEVLLDQQGEDPLTYYRLGKEKFQRSTSEKAERECRTSAIIDVDSLAHVADVAKEARMVIKDEVQILSAVDVANECQPDINAEEQVPEEGEVRCCPVSPKSTVLATVLCQGDQSQRIKDKE